MTVLTGDDVTVSGLASEGHPAGYSWYITPPGASVPSKPTSTAPVYGFSPDFPGLWSVALVADYQHSAIGGGLWSSDDCITVAAASVVAAIGLSSTQIATDEELALDGFSSQWAFGVIPQVRWRIDGLAFGACNGGPPPATPDDLHCTVPGNWLAPGWHSAGLKLTDPASGDISVDTRAFEVIEIIPLSVDFGWTPVEPEPGEIVSFTAVVDPPTSEQDFTRVTWDMGDGFVEVFTSCPPLFFNTCLLYPYSFAEGWYDVTVTVETAEESASRSYPVKIGDPVTPPVASFTLSPPSPMLLEATTLSFDGTCEGQCQWAWDFGDGLQSTAQNPAHAWQIPTTYQVILTVTNESGSDVASTNVAVSSCWFPGTPVQLGTCSGGPVFLTAPAGNSWLWNTGETGQTTAAPLPGSYWVDIDDGTGCWGHSPSTVVLENCGDPGGDANLDGSVDAADLSALIPELTDGDGDSVVGAGGGDLTAPGGDVTRDFRLRTDDLVGILINLFN